jgi:hypothetical protein
MLTPVQNYWTPLASQVKELDNPPPPLNHILLIQHASPHQRVTLPCHPITSTRIAWPGGADARPTSAQHITSTHLRLKTKCALAY